MAATIRRRIVVDDVVVDDVVDDDAAAVVERVTSRGRLLADPSVEPVADAPDRGQG